MRLKILQTLKGHYSALIEKHTLNVEIHLANPMGVAEHSDHLETVEKELAQIAHNRDLLGEVNRMMESTTQSL